MTATEQELRDVSAALGGRYQVERLLGRGGMGAVYLARDLQLDRLVAVKILPRDFAADVMLRERFVRETRVAASFSHPNIVPVHAVEDGDGLLAFVMGYVEGETLAQRVARAGPLSPRESVRAMQDIAYALAYAHGRGVVHRDIKPDNIMLERATGRALLMDFGVSRGVSAAETAPAMTRVGESVGTPEFMSPEQAAGESLDGRSDLYSLGLTAYFALLGKPAYGGDSVQRTLVRQLTEPVPPLASLRADLPAALASAVDRCLLKDREARFADAGALVEALDVANAAAPEMPTPIRLFQQEASTLGLVIVFVGLFMWFFIVTVVQQSDTDDALIPLVVLVAVLWSRIAQTFSEARRLLSQGFTVDDVMRGFGAGMAELEARRQQLQRDPATQQARRRTVIVAVLMLVMAPILVYAALSMRIEVRPNYYQSHLGGILLLLSGLLLFGFSVPLLMRSPFRMSPGERMFRRVWMGWPGRLFLNAAAKRGGKGVRTSGAGAGAAPVAKPAVVKAGSGSDSERIARLEARVEKLERRAVS